MSLFFLFTVLVIAIPSLIYSRGYLKGKYSTARIVLGQLLSLAFILSMMLLVTVNNALIFLIVWELMSLFSYFLVVFESEQEKSIHAGTIYIVMTHIGTAFIVAALFIMYKYAGSFDFAIMKETSLAMPGSLKNIIFLLLLIGFGTKAGIVPLHMWLPYAHPQAPSHISSIMSGVMIKTAIYGLVRFVIFILGIHSAWWGYLMLMLAAISSLAGVIYALMEHDLKKLLAYHSVENIGIILFGIGASMIFLKMDMPVLAVFALSAGLYHLINHAIFKGLLFLCAGSVYKATGTRDMEKLGGLIHRMPWTACCFLIGAMAISGLPPLNGFVSEWLTLQAFFWGALQGQGSLKVILSLCAMVLAFTSGLAAACFVKAFGITFLALPRSGKAQAAEEAALSMKAGMMFLSCLVVVFGLGAGMVMRILTKVSGCAAGIDVSNICFTLNNFTLSVFHGSGIYLSPPLMALVLSGLMGIIVLCLFIVLGRSRARISRTWDCGYYRLDARNEYTATAFSKPFRIAFSFFLLPYRRTEKIRESFYHVKSFLYETNTTQVFVRYIYEPLLTAVIKTAKYLRRIQPGSIHIYIAYIFATLLLLIIFRERF